VRLLFRDGSEYYYQFLIRSRTLILVYVRQIHGKKEKVMYKNRSVVLVVGLGSRRRPLIAALECHGYETLEAQDGFGALQMAIDRDVDVLITDDEMPGLTGSELIGIVRKHGAVGHCLLLSDLGSPFDPEQVLLKVRESCPVPSLQLH
jgi:CheY-like chemotaxis protein